MLLELAYYGDPILRKKSKPVEEINDEIRELITNMIETMEHRNGIGLAAPQVFRSLNLFITSAPIFDEENKQWLPGKLRVFINAKLSNPSSDVWEYNEGCLSIPGVYAPVVRPWKITVEALDFDGNPINEEFHGMEARVIQHEYDHIRGVLFVDCILGKERQRLDPLLKEVSKKYYKKK